MTGASDGNELANRFRQSHVFVMPYSHEGFGMAYLEAMAFGVPVMGSSDGAVKEFVIPGRNGFLFKTDDFDSVNASIQNLHHDRQLLRKMSHAAFRAYKDRPKWNDTMESIHRFLTGLAESKL
jgi:glycosyltransferase involved in cell wall biosynthesis